MSEGLDCMKHHRLLNIFTLLIIVMGNFTPALAYPLQDTRQPQALARSQTGIRVLRADLSGLTLALDTPGFEVQRSSSGKFDELTIPDGELWGDPGHPQLPVISGLIGIPPDAEVILQITRGDSTLLEGQYTLLPGPQALPLEYDLEPGQMGHEPDPAAYANDTWIPSSPVQLGEEAWIRDQRVMLVTFFPFQYNPAQRALRWHEHLQAEITFSGGRATNTFTESPFEDAFSASLLNYQASRFWRMAGDQLPVKQSTSYQSLGSRFDITVRQDGIYHVTYDDLKAAGMDVDNINPTTFHLYNQEEDVAIYVYGEGDESFDGNDYIAFYGEKFRGDILAEKYAAMMTQEDGKPGNNWFWLCTPGTCDLADALEQYTDDNVYSLTVGGTPGPRMGTVDGTPNGGTLASVYTTTVHGEESNYWWSHEYYSEDVWFWSQTQQPTSALPFASTYEINLTAVALGSYNATVHAEVASRNATSGYPDHHTQFFINTRPTALEDAYWDGRTRHTMTAQIPQGDLVEGTNILTFIMQPDVSPGTTRMYFDFYEITYTREFVAENNNLAFSRYAPGTWKYVIPGFTSSTVEVYNITNRFVPIRVLNTNTTGSGTYTTSFKATDGSKASYFLAGTSSILSPYSIVEYQPPDFANMPEADYLFISHQDLIPSLQPLVAYRKAQGLSVAIVDIDDLYREFNDGIYHPIAIKNFLIYAFENWQTPPSYVTLVGSGHWNFKSYGGYPSPPIYMPPNLAYIDPWQGQVDSANLLATVVGDDTLPDLNIARIPASTPAELEVVVNKTLAYETQAVQDWQGNITFIADNTPDSAGDFVGLAEGAIAEFLDSDPYFQPLRIFQNDFGCINAGQPQCQAVTYAITNTLSTGGSLLASYIGHGALNRWSGQSIFLNSDVPTMNNPDQLPVILSMTCLDGYWFYPAWPGLDPPDPNFSLVQVLLTTEGKGAVATYSPTGLGVATGHDDLQRGFFSSLFNHGHWELGQAAFQSKVKLFATNNNFDLMHTFTVFGDPALHISTPFDVEIAPVSALQSVSPGQAVTYTLDITNSGLVADVYTITLNGIGWDASASQTTTGPLPPSGSTSVDVIVNIPANALGNQTDTLKVIATSKSDGHKQATSTLITMALTDGLLLTPSSQAASGPPGTSLDYTIQLKNTTNATDVFNLTLTGNNWTTNLSTAALSLGPGETQTFHATVEIPSTALGNDLDQATVVAQSTNDPENAALTTFSSTAITIGFTLTPSQQTESGPAGQSVAHVLQIKNLLNTPEYYTVTLSGQQWGTTAPVTVGPANPGQTMNFLVKVNIPSTATTGMSDSVIVTVSMLNDPGVQSTSELITIVSETEHSIFLPLIEN